MTDGRTGVGALAWIERRVPPAVMSLELWVASDPADTVRRFGESDAARGATSAPPVDELVRAADAALARALASPGRVRDSAFHLLAADALLTYACEAALDGEEPEERIEWILQSILDR